MKPHNDPEALISLGEIASILNLYFGFKGDEKVDYENPFSWWRRSQRNHEIALPMPEPVMRHGKRRSPLFLQADILFWYGDWKNLDVPMGVGAGDSRRGKAMVAGARRG